MTYYRTEIIYQADDQADASRVLKRMVANEIKTEHRLLVAMKPEEDPDQRTRLTTAQGVTYTT